MKLSLKGNSVTGYMSTRDKSGEVVRGTINGEILELERDTGLNTIQHFRLNVTPEQMTGEFWNSGQDQDSGTIEMMRAK